MSQILTDSRLANLAAVAIQKEFNAYHAQFKKVTQRARLRFCNRDWQGMRADSAERLDLYRRAVNRIETMIRSMLADRVHAKMVWVSLKAVSVFYFRSPTPIFMSNRKGPMTWFVFSKQLSPANESLKSTHRSGTTNTVKRNYTVTC
jgi:hypothetical protein